MRRRFLPFHASLALVLCLALLPFSTRAETPMGSVIESRLLIGLKTNGDAVNAMMPEGWVSIPYPKGPFTGANAILALLDAHLVLGPDGAPAAPATRTTAAILGLGKQADGKSVRQFVLKVYTDNPEANPYGNTVAASVQRTRLLAGDSQTGRIHSEDWTVTAEDGTLSVSLNYPMGTAGWSLGKSAAFSASDPDFAVSQSYQQLAHLVMSKSVGKPLAGEMSHANTLAGLSGLLDGNEDVQAIVNIPIYIREIFLP